MGKVNTDAVTRPTFAGGDVTMEVWKGIILGISNDFDTALSELRCIMSAYVINLMRKGGGN